jgi:hypothetical protein
MNWKWALFSSAMLKASNLEFTTKSGNLIYLFCTPSQFNGSFSDPTDLSTPSQT